ncbi:MULTISPECIES: ribbon-helix-helix protein, CopG family [Sulfolobaceae]|uniref:Ribbon-helix-helix protein, CopG family n=1 Tax=Sulfurisphaera ohwakuensis TaxID=69656 RepID=A0A650CKS7_SULOH|nr:MULTISPECIES: ribbon-helix-helix protein, CopG family [Sulfolobaceae]QGR18450.1 ribbon-helix-helix protein, CopG family [Sulfurisphaera ohwakuensis]QIW25347.1 ribbon-helix-helix protein, CopG family [Sulfolobus sp. S-194]
MRVVTFKIEEDLLQQLDLYALNNRITRSEIIREALIRYLREKKAAAGI